ncbi:MAG: hypothetical protein ACK5M3_13185 [Dysgonomonas sp.]
MKKTVLLITILFLGISIANAQIGKGHVMVGGTVADLNVDFDTHTSFSLTPKALWFVKDGTAIGAYAKFGFNHNNGEDGSSYAYGVGPIARSYFSVDKIPAFRKTKLFLEANVGFEGTDSSVSHSNTNGLGFGVGPGLSYFITPTVGLEASLKYEGIVGFGSNTYTNGLNFLIGFQVFLPSKKLIKEIKDDFSR